MGRICYNIFSTSDGGLFSIEFSDYHTGFAGGSEGILYKSGTLTPGDLSGPWNINLDLSASTPTIIYSISFPSETNGMFCVGYSLKGENNTLVYHTNNTGDSWSAEPDTIAGLLSGKLHAPDVSNAWAVGSAGKIFKGEAILLGIRENGLDIAEVDL